MHIVFSYQTQHNNISYSIILYTTPHQPSSATADYKEMKLSKMKIKPLGQLFCNGFPVRILSLQGC